MEEMRTSDIDSSYHASRTCSRCHGRSRHRARVHGSQRRLHVQVRAHVHGSRRRLRLRLQHRLGAQVRVTQCSRALVHGGLRRRHSVQVHATRRVRGDACSDTRVLQDLGHCLGIITSHATRGVRGPAYSLMLACSKASNTASASAPPMPPEAYAVLHALVLACSKASDTASASPPPPPDAHALAFTDLFSSSTRLATSLTNSQVYLAAPADHLAHSMSILAEKIVEGSNGLEEAAANVKNAASTLLVAADNPKASEELAGESRDFAARILQLTHDVEDQAREDAAGAKFTDQDVLPGCEQCADRSCLCPWLFGSCTSPSGGCSTSQPRRAVDEKQETLRDKWTTFFTFSMPASLAVLPLLEKHISQGYSALLGYSYGAIFFSAAAGLLLSMNATADSDVQVARYLGNLSVLALSVLVSLYVWTSLGAGSIWMIAFFLAAIVFGHGCAWLRCLFSGNPTPTKHN
uniref:Uncharacterized protein n=1 Tax=Oryza meridionalis TaxID=40149 RepID=A0A0E0CBH7_9ORYZ